MAKYTMELRDVVKYTRIFDFHYDFYDEKKRPEFEENFIRHFYFHEIGAETIDRFKVFLQDKMKTVFPYYNAMFKATQIQYDVLDNYKLTETFKRNVENVDKMNDVSYTVGRTNTETSGESQENRSAESTSKTDTTGENTTSATDVTKTTGEGSNNATVNTTENKSSSGEDTSGNNTVQKYLDTPQGLTNLSDSKYLTNLTDTTANGSNSSERSENNSSEQITTGSNTSETETNATRNESGNSSVNVSGEGSETAETKATAKQNAESRISQDNNTRRESMGKQVETYEIIRRGNIGVDTDSDGIIKHLKLQKMLTEIEKLFFAECEDLFMLVY